MRLSVSNIAWNIDEEAAAAELLAEAGIAHVDVAPGKYFPDPAGATDGEIATVGSWWRERGFAILGMQSLLFGTAGLNLFADADGRMFERLAQVCRIGGRLGARALTFGSPRQRDRTGIDDATATAIAVDFFGRLGERAQTEGVIVCLEPNAAIYGCNFMVATTETAAIVEAVAHAAIRLQLDVGTIALNDEPAAATVARVAPLIGHIHASEPQLRPLGDAGAPHQEVADTLRRLGRDDIVTIEMARASDEPPLDAVRRAIGVAKASYGR